jgi:hypothetical protein
VRLGKKLDSSVRGKTKKRRWNFVQTDINIRKIINCKEKSQTSDWNKSIKGAKIRIGLWCHPRQEKEVEGKAK